MLSHQYPALLVVAPLIMAFVAAISGWFRKGAPFYIAAATLAVCAAVSVSLLIQVATGGPVLYKLGGWNPPMGIVYYVDGLNALVLAVVSIAALINLVGTKKVVEREHEGKRTAFYALYLLAVCGHLGMVATGDAFNLYVLLEISALSGYSLLGMGDKRAPLATLNYLMIGTIGASFYLLGVGYLYIQTGSLNMADIAVILGRIGPTPTIMAAGGLILTGIMIKMAFFPLHGWLPNAYTCAPTASSGLIAPMTTKVMVYVMIRMMLTVFTPDIVFSPEGLSTVMVILASVAIVVCAFMALSARNLKRMLTLILITEVGYMVGGAWLGNRTGMTGAILHIVNDAAMTLCVFLAAAGITYKMRRLYFDNLQGLFKKMPFTMGAFAVGAISMIGVPPTCGFFSKWYLLLGAVQAGRYEFAAALIISSLINVVLFFRIFEICFFEPFAEHGHGHEHGEEGGHAPAPAMAEAPLSLVAPLTVAALGLIALGLYTSEIVKIIQPAIPASIPGVF